MLTVKRKPGEAIIVGNDTVITIVAVEGRQVTVHVTAPAGVRIDREEVAFRRACGQSPMIPPRGGDAELPLEARGPNLAVR